MRDAGCGMRDAKTDARGGKREDDGAVFRRGGRSFHAKARRRADSQRKKRELGENFGREAPVRRAAALRGSSPRANSGFAAAGRKVLRLALTRFAQDDRRKKGGSALMPAEKSGGCAAPGTNGARRSPSTPEKPITPGDCFHPGEVQGCPEIASTPEKPRLPGDCFHPGEAKAARRLPPPRRSQGCPEIASTPEKPITPGGRLYPGEPMLPGGHLHPGEANNCPEVASTPETEFRERWVPTFDWMGTAVRER